MVMSNMGVPEPPDPDQNLPSNPDISLHVDSEPEDENPYEGYERLPMAPVEAESSSEDEEEAVEVSDGLNLPTISSAEAELVKEVWEAPVQKDFDLDIEKVEQVKAALVNFTLPASNIPDWASQIPEAEWKEQIMKRIQHN